MIKIIILLSNRTNDNVINSNNNDALLIFRGVSDYCLIIQIMNSFKTLWEVILYNKWIIF